MGRYIDDILQPGEKVLYSTNAHWVFFGPAILLWILAAVLLALSGMAVVTGPLMLVCLALAGVVGDELAADYVIPSPFDERVAPAVTAAVAAAARAEGVARR